MLVEAERTAGREAQERKYLDDLTSRRARKQLLLLHLSAELQRDRESKFIQTESWPPLMWLPAIHNDKTKKAIETRQQARDSAPSSSSLLIDLDDDESVMLREAIADDERGKRERARQRAEREAKIGRAAAEAEVAAEEARAVAQLEQEAEAAAKQVEEGEEGEEVNTDAAAGGAGAGQKRKREEGEADGQEDGANDGTVDAAEQAQD